MTSAAETPFAEMGELPVLQMLCAKVEQGKPQKPESDTVDAVVWRLFQACDIRYRQQTAAKQPIAPAELLLLAWVTVCLAEEAKRQLWGKPAEVLAAKFVGRAMARFELRRVMAERVGLDSVMRCRASFEQFDQLATDFEEAIQPQRLGCLVKDREELRDRSRVFMKRQRIPGPAFRNCLATLLMTRKLSLADVDRFCARVRPARLRTFRKKKLLEMADNYTEWDPVVRCFDPSTKDSEGGPLRGVLEKTIRRLRKKWNPCGPDDLEDAVHGALADRLDAYVYEGSLLAWLAVVALNRLKDLAGQQMAPLPNNLPAAKQQGPIADQEETGRKQADLPKELPPASQQAPTIDQKETGQGKENLAEYMVEWALLFLLAVSPFGPDVRRRAKIIWEAILSENRGGEKLSNAELAERINREFDTPITTTTVSGTRRRLQQRLIVLQGVYSFGLDDEQALERVKRQVGLAEADRSILRYLAAMARVAQQGNRLPDLVFVAMALRGRESFDAAYHKVAPLVSEEVEERLLCVEECFAVLEPARILAHFKRTLADANLSFLEIPLLFLTLVEGKDAKQIAGTLRLAQGEACAIAEAIPHIPVVE